jgi:cation:H+ antiporter
MSDLLTSILIGLGALGLLMWSAELAVKKILGILHHYGFSNTFGGLVIFSVSTSFPEMFAHFIASWGIITHTLDYRIASSTVLGANIGSDVIQQTLILGIVVFLLGKLKFEKGFLKTAYLPMIATTLETLILAWDGTLSRLDGLILVGTFVVYMLYLYHKEEEGPHIMHKGGNSAWDFLIALGCMVLMLFSAHFLLSTTEDIVLATGLGGSLIGVISLGVASATPELFTAIYGLKQKATGLSLGVLIGSNITNPLVAIGGGALISTYWVPRPLVLWDLPMEAITASILLVYLLKKKGDLHRGGALYLICLYFVYLAVRFMYFSVD